MQYKQNVLIIVESLLNFSLTLEVHLQLPLSKKTTMNNLNYQFIILLCVASSALAQDRCPIKPAILKASNNAKRQQLLNAVFPSIEILNLKNVASNFPENYNTKPTIAVVLFTDRGRPVANPWTETIIKKYRQQEVNLVELVLLGNGLKLIRPIIRKGMRKDVDTIFHSNYNTHFGKAKAYKKILMMNDKNSCYIYVLDKQGSIKYTTDGYMNDEKMMTLQNKTTQLMNTTNTNLAINAKDTITIIMDPLCGFCYAFEPGMQKVIDANKNKFVFDVVPGGMILGAQVGPISAVAPHIAHAYKDLEKMSTSKFGDKFLNGFLKNGIYIMNSEMPCIAITVFKSMQPQNTLAFAYDVQKMLYYDGISLNEAENYKTLGLKYNLYAEDFITKLNSAEWKTKTYAQFTFVETLGIQGFPAVSIKREGIETVFVNGFKSFEEMMKGFPFK
jgi:putative protein-disulfide isomerase